METNYYLQAIREDLSKRQRTNPQYSLRAYARDLDIHPSTLSQVLKGSRPLPLKNSKFIAHKLELSPKENTLFMESLFKSKTRLDAIQMDEQDERFMIDESYHRVISEWEYLTVIPLFDLKDFIVNASSVAERLNITINRAEIVLHHLETCGFISKNSFSNYQRLIPRVRTTEDISSVALKKGHRETLELGIKKLDETEVELRDFSSMALAIDLSKITEAKTIIREFRQKLAALLRDGEKTEVYQLAIQFYPLTQTQKSKQE